MAPRSASSPRSRAADPGLTSRDWLDASASPGPWGGPDVRTEPRRSRPDRPRAGPAAAGQAGSLLPVPPSATSSSPASDGTRRLAGREAFGPRRLQRGGPQHAVDGHVPQHAAARWSARCRSPPDVLLRPVLRRRVLPTATRSSGTGRTTVVRYCPPGATPAGSRLTDGDGQQHRVAREPVGQPAGDQDLEQLRRGVHERSRRSHALSTVGRCSSVLGPTPGTPWQASGCSR